MMTRVLVAGTVLAVFVALAPHCAAATGQEIFNSQCASCHRVGPESGDKWLSLFDTKGPILAYAGTKFIKDYLQRWLQEPTPVSGGYPYFKYTRPTDHGDRLVAGNAAPHPALRGEELAAVVNYLGELQAPIQPFPNAAPTKAISGQIMVDKILACAGCHQTSSGQPPHSGPTLVGVRQRLSDMWLRSYVHNPQQWGTLTMPRGTIRADQLAAAVDFLLRDDPAPASANTAAGDPVLSADAGLRPQPALDTGRRPALLYRMLCTQCHGLEGNGKGINAQYLSVEPRNHRDYETMRKLSDEHLFRVIRYGGTAVGKSALMPAWGGVLQEDEITALVAYLRELSQTSLERK
jgi:mono/diheme cytochrome c family protein